MSVARFLWPGTLLLLAGATPRAGHRSPAHLALTADGRWAVTANADSGTASLVDLRGGSVAAETACGTRPFDVALSGNRAVVTNRASGDVTVLSVDPPRLERVAAIAVGEEPRGVALSEDGRTAWVALAAEDAVVRVDLEARRVTGRAAVGDEPWHLARSGAVLAVGNARSGEVTLLDAASLETVRTVPVGGRNLRGMAVSPDGAWVYVPHITDMGSTTTLRNIERGRVLVNRLSRVPLRDGAAGRMSMDPEGVAGADLEDVAVSPDGTRLAVTSGGTRTIFLMETPLPFTDGDPPRVLPIAGVRRGEPFRRSAVLGKRPLGAAFTPDGDHVVLTDYFESAVKVVAFASGKVVRTIPLGAVPERSEVRWGEELFHDSRLSWQEWFTCHTCHAEGHANGGRYDTFNDGRSGNPKAVLSLRGVRHTGPWTWHGWQDDLGASVKRSVLRTMEGPDLSPARAAALRAYLETLEFAPPGPRGEAEARGEAVFNAKACDACHAPPHYTAPETYLVGLEDPKDRYKGFNPPPLRGVRHRGPFLHDGRAETLEEVLRVHHRPLKLNGKPDCTEKELADLVAFLRSL